MTTLTDPVPNAGSGATLPPATADMLRRVLEVRIPHQTVASPTGDLLAVTASRKRDEVHVAQEDLPAGMPNRYAGHQLLVLPAAGGDAVPVIPDAEASWGPSWDPDGHRLACFACRDGEVGVWVWSAQNQTATLVHAGPLAVALQGPQWTRDGDLVVLVPAASDGSSVAATEAANPSVEVLFAPGREGGPIPIPDSRSDLMDLVRLDIESGAAARLASDLAVDNVVMSPDRGRLALVSRGKRRSRQFATDRTLAILDVITGETLDHVEGISSLGTGTAGPFWSPGSDRLAFIRDGKAVVHTIGHGEVELPGPGTLVDGGYWALLWSSDGRYLIGEDTWDATGRALIGMDGPPHLWSMDVEAATFTPIDLPDGCGMPEVFRQSGTSTFWQDADGRLAVVAREPESRKRQLWWAPLDGGPAQRSDIGPALLPQSGGLLLGMAHADVAADGTRVFYRAESEQTPPEILTMTRDGRVSRLSNLNDGLFDEPLPAARILHWTDRDGHPCIGSLVMPIGHDGTSTVPVIVDTYPMPNWCDSHDEWEAPYVLFRQLLLAEGYAVFTPSVTELPKRYWQRADMDRPIVSGLDELVRLGIADDRFGVIGMSGGGYMVNAVITTTTRFKAAVSGVGFSNLSSWFGQVYRQPDGSGYTHGVTGGPNIAGGTPSEVPDSYLDNSPVFHLGEVETPLLIFHGSKDAAATATQGHEMYVGLKYRGIEVTALNFLGEGHGPMWFTEPNRTHLIERVLDLFRRHVLGEVSG